MTKSSTDGMFLTFPAISMSKSETSNEVNVDRFDISVVADYIIAINEIAVPNTQAMDAVTLVHFDPKSGLRPIMSGEDSQVLLDLLVARGHYFPMMSIKAVAAGEPTGDVPNTVEYNVNVDMNQIVAVNSLDGTAQQITKDVRTIIYFKPSSGMQPVLSSVEAKSVQKDARLALHPEFE